MGAIRIYLCCSVTIAEKSRVRAVRIYADGGISIMEDRTMRSIGVDLNGSLTLRLSSYQHRQY